MSLLGQVDYHGTDSPVQSKGPTVLLPHEAIGNVVTKTNNLLMEHRDWLANLPQRKERIKQQANAVVPPASLITPPPSSINHGLQARQNLILPECSSISSSASLAGAASASSQFAISLAAASSTITSLQGALVSAQSAFASAQLSAAVALSTASVSARAVSSNASIQIISASSSASSAISSIQASASSAVSVAQASASNAIRSAQTSASLAVLSANNALTSVQMSASSAISSASAVALSADSAANGARATASLALQSAQASVSAAQQQASATRVAAMNETVLALTITFSIIGSSLISILVYYLISRCRRRRRERKQSELKEKIHRLRHESSESMAPSLSAFPMPVGRKAWLTRSRPDTVETAEMTGTGTGMLSGSPTLLNSGPLPGSATRQTWAPSREVRERGGGGAGGQRSQSEMDFGFGNGNGNGGSTFGSRDTRKTWAARDAIPEERPMMVRKNALTYDPEHPERPPKFTTWLEESFRSVSPFPNMEDEEELARKSKGHRLSYFPGGPLKGQKKLSLIQRRRSKSMGEISDIGTAF